MYNYTISFIKGKIFDKQISDINITHMKKHLSLKKDLVHNRSKLIFNNKTVYINKHILDYAINDAILTYKSCTTNMKNGNIKSFRLRYLKLNKPNKIIKIEKLLFTNNGFCKSVLGEVLCSIKNFDYKNNIYTTAIIKKIKNKYVLLLKYPKKEKKVNRYKNETISFDPGIRTMLTGVSNNSFIEIGKNIQKNLTDRLEQIDRISNKNKNKMNDNKKKKVINKKYKKIKNRVNDIHWKIISYITKNYKNVLFGNFSTKRMGEGKQNKMTKRVGQMMRFFEFKTKLKYKCSHTRTNFKEVNESYTSQCCCNCGNRKLDLGGNKKYECVKCKIKMDRDCNSAINIIYASL